MNASNRLIAAAVGGMLAGVAGCGGSTPEPAMQNEPATQSEPAMESEPAMQGAGEGDDMAAEPMDEAGGDEMAPPEATEAGEGAKHACKGQNDCKGQGGCKTDKHACKGQNDCKGQGGCKG